VTDYPLLLVLVHLIITPPVVESIEVVGALIYDGADAATIYVIGEKFPIPHTFSAAILN
jgi:hypothetical protein